MPKELKNILEKISIIAAKSTDVAIESLEFDSRKV